MGTRAVQRSCWDKSEAPEERRADRYRNFNPGGEDRGQNHGSDSDENGGANPNPEAAILWVVDCGVCRIEGNHD